MRIRSLIATAFVAAWLLTPLGMVMGQPAIPPVPAPSTSATNPAPTPPTSLSGYVPDDKYKLRIGDHVSFQIMEDGDPPRAFIVTDFGEINFPYVGRHLVKDKTCREVCDMLKGELEKEYYYQATPILALDLANPITGKIYIYGQVRTTGPLELFVNDPLTVGKAIMRAGGFAEFANRKKVRLMRGTDKDNQPRQVFELNLDEILSQGKSDKDMAVQPDDFIMVPSRLVNF